MEKTLQQWKMPDSYFGFNPIGDYGVYSRHRDSDTLTNSNWECLLKHFKELEKNYVFHTEPMEKYQTGFSTVDETPDSWVYVWSASHWAVGYIEYMMLREDAPKELHDQIEEVMDDLRNVCPVFNEDHYSAACWENKCQLWDMMSVKERIYYCQKAEISIFAARRKELPCEVDQYIDD